MIKKTITYLGYDDQSWTEDFYFNLSKSELIDLEVQYPGGFKAMLESIIKTRDGKLIMDSFHMIIRKSYGERSADGKRFDKSPEILERFIRSQAYDNLFMELTLQANSAAEFVTGLLPTGFLEDVEKSKAANESAKQANAKADLMEKFRAKSTSPINKSADEVLGENQDLYEESVKTIGTQAALDFFKNRVPIEEPKSIFTMPDWEREHRDPTQAELVSMSQQELEYAVQTRMRHAAEDHAQNS